MRCAAGVMLCVLAGCASSLSSPTTTVCTAIGGYSGITVRGDSAAQVCLDGGCQATIPAANGEVMARFDEVHESDKSHVVTVDLVRYEGPVPFKMTMPNGKGCPPRLYQATMTLRNGTLSLG